MAGPPLDGLACPGVFGGGLEGKAEAGAGEHLTLETVVLVGDGLILVIGHRNTRFPRRWAWAATLSGRGKSLHHSEALRGRRGRACSTVTRTPEHALAEEIAQEAEQRPAVALVVEGAAGEVEADAATELRRGGQFLHVIEGDFVGDLVGKRNGAAAMFDIIKRGRWSGAGRGPGRPGRCHLERIARVAIAKRADYVSQEAVGVALRPTRRLAGTTAGETHRRCQTTPRACDSRRKGRSWAGREALVANRRTLLLNGPKWWPDDNCFRSDRSGQCGGPVNASGGSVPLALVRASRCVRTEHNRFQAGKGSSAPAATLS
jgi:hypothetical protein